MYDLVTIGSISIDLYFKGESLTFLENRFQLAVGGKYFTDYFHEGVGGGAANVAIGVQKSGLSTAIVGIIGQNDFKHFITETLRKNHVSDYYCKYKKNYYNISAILLAESGEKTIINFQNHNGHSFSDEREVEGLKKGKGVFIANAVENKLKVLHKLKNIDTLKFINLGKKDSGHPIEEIKEIFKESNVVILNGHEFADIIKKSYEEISFHENILNEYFPDNDGILIITDGHKGSFGYTKKKVFFQKAIEPKKIADATGAGDGYSAGFIAEFIKSGNIIKSMEKGAKYACKILEKIGAN